MGLCQSPAPLIVGLIETYKAPIPPVRLWIDTGSGEIRIGIWQSSYDAARKLVALGFVQNDNFAFHVGRNQGHEKFDCNLRLRHALYFLLRSKTPQLTRIELAETDTLGDGPIRLARTGHVVLEPVYENGFRLTDCTAKITVADPAVATFDDATNELRPLAPGHTTISSSFAGREIVQQLDVPAPEPPLPCPATTRPVAVDGDLSEWSELPHEVKAPQSDDAVLAWTGPSDLSYRFACTHDDQFLYIALKTTDDHMNSEPDKDPWFQDGIEVRVDARPAAERLVARGENEGGNILLIAMSPGRTGESRIPYKASTLPQSTKAACKATPTGHDTEIAIPIAHLNEKAGKPWTDVRVNIVVNDLDDDYKAFNADKLWWQPDWRSAGNRRGSGTFERQAAAR